MARRTRAPGRVRVLNRSTQAIVLPGVAVIHPGEITQVRRTPGVLDLIRAGVLHERPTTQTKEGI